MTITRHRLRPLVAVLTAVTAAVGAGLLAPPAQAQSSAGGVGTRQLGPGYYRPWATNVNVRLNNVNPRHCDAFPSVARCPVISAVVNPADLLQVICQKQPGQNVGGNPYWLWVRTPRGRFGWMASYYIDYPSNRLPVPDCSF